VWRILKPLEMNRLPSSQRHKPLERRWKRYEQQQPGHRIQMDVKFIEPLAGARKPRYYQFTAIDDCTRLRVLRIYPENNQPTAIQLLDYLCQKLPFRVEVIQTDIQRDGLHDPPVGRQRGRNSFEHELRRRQIVQKNSRPNHPTTCGKVNPTRI
jgi:hypothetical protein